jgi:MFS family permease
MAQEAQPDKSGADGVEPPYGSGPLAGLTPNVVRLGLVSLLTDVSSEMLYPLVPIFLTAVLGAPMVIVGIIEGVAEATASLLRTVSGRLSDLSGRRRPYVMAGYWVSAVAKPLIAFAAGWPLVLAARVGDRFGKGLRDSARDALLADSVHPDYLGRAFGWHRAMDTLGAVIGPLLAIGLVQAAGGNLRAIFLLSFVPGALGAGLVFAVRERGRRGSRPQAAGIGYRALPEVFRGYLIAWGSFAVANSSDVFLLLRAKQLGYTTTLVIGLYAFYNLVYALASPGLGRLSDELGRKKVLVGGLGAFALVYLGFAVASRPWQLWVLFTTYGLYTAATDGVGKALAVDLVPAAVRASAIGLLGTVTGLATLAASSIAGLLWTALGPWAAFGYGALGALAGCVLLVRLPVPKGKVG